MTETFHGTTRRTLVKAGAWTVPVVASAAAAPSAMASATACTFELSVDTRLDWNDTQVFMTAIPHLLHGDCADDAPYGKPLSVDLTFYDDLTGFYQAPGWTPETGEEGTYTYTLVSTYIYAGFGDSGPDLNVTAERVPGARRKGVAFRFFGEGVKPENVFI